MRIMKKFVVLLLSAILIQHVVFAEENIDNNMSQNKRAAVTLNKLDEGTLIEIDNSNLVINVVQQTVEGGKTIYTGPVSGYEYGDSLLNLDFSEIEFVVLFDWNDPDDEVVYITPVKSNQNIIKEITQEDEDSDIISKEIKTDNIRRTLQDDVYNELNQVTNEVIATDNTELEIENEVQSPINYEYSIKDIDIRNNAGLKVNSLQRGSIASQIIISKNTNEQLSAKVFAALYDGGVLKTMKILDLSNEQPVDEYVAYNLNMNLTNITEDSILKIMIWNGTTLKPYSLSLSSFFGYTTQISTVINQLYTIPINSNSGADKYKLMFDDEYFNIEDLCKDADNKITQVGNATENIRIDEITNSSVTFSFMSNSQGQYINKIVLRAKKTGNTELRIDEILQ